MALINRGDDFLQVALGVSLIIANAAVCSLLAAKRSSRRTKQLLRRLCSSLAAGAALAGCGEESRAKAIDRWSSEEHQRALETIVRSATIPADVRYVFTETGAVPGAKRSIDVLLNKKVSNEVLRAIALELKEEAPQEFERTFMSYYLLGAPAGAGAWATTHFNPDLEVATLDLTTQEERDIRSGSAPIGRRTLGRWLDERPYAGGMITVFHENGQVLMTREFKDGSVLTRLVIASQSPLGRRIDTADRSSHGDYWVVNSHGDLEIRDSEGLIATARKL